MIIRLIAESEAERKRFGGQESVEHVNVKEYFFAGNKLDPEGSIVDFHEWNGGFRYLIGTLRYFYELINDDRRKAAKQDNEEIVTIGKNKAPIQVIKRGFGGPIQPLDISKLQHTAQADIPAEDEFVEEKPSLRFEPAMGEQAEMVEDVDVVVENLEDQIKNEATDKLKKGLRIIP